MRLSKKKITPKVEKEIYRLFYQTMADLRSPDEARAFFEEILTKTERQAIAKRLAVAVYLEKGQSYEEIKKALKISSATVANVAEQSKKGEGFEVALKKVRADQWATKWAEKIAQMMGKKP